MKSEYSIYEAKAKLSEILRAVRRKRPVIITDRGRPVARVVPFDPPDSLVERIDELTRYGIVSRATPKGSWKPIARRPGALARFLEQRD